MKLFHLVCLLVVILCIGIPLSSQQTDDELVPNEGTLMMHGQPFFPLGFYHVSWAGEPQQKRQALETIAAAGYNIMHPSLNRQDQDFLDRAAELGVFIIAEPNEPNGAESVINQFREHPAVLGWLVADDFNAPAMGHTPQSILEMHTLVKSIAPNAYTYMSGNTVNMTPFVGSADLVGIQTYSVPWDPIGNVGMWLDEAYAISNPQGKPVIANIQAYAGEGYRAPTIHEVRNSTYQAFLSGVKGILFYTYFDPIWNIEDDTELLQGFYQLGPELQRFAPVLIYGEYTPLETGNDQVVAGQWELFGKAFVVAINLDDEDPQTVNIPLSYEDPHLLVPMFEGLPSGMEIQSSELVGEIQPYDVHVYSIGNLTHLPTPILPISLNVTLPVVEIEPTPPLGDYVLLAEESMSIQENTHIYSGDVGVNKISEGPFINANSELALNDSVTMHDPTSRLIADTITLRSYVRISNVQYNELLGGGSIEGNFYPGVNFPLVEFFPVAPEFTAVGEDLTLRNEVDHFIEPGNYGMLDVGPLTHVYFTGGIYNFSNWKVSNESSLFVLGPTEIRIEQPLKTGSDVYIGPDPDNPVVDASEIVIYSIAVNAVEDEPKEQPYALQFGLQNRVFATVIVPNGTLRVGSESTITGALIARWIIVANDNQFYHASAFDEG